MARKAGFAQALEAALMRWLEKTADGIVRDVFKSQRSRKMRVRTVRGAHKISIVVQGPHAARLGFDHAIDIPMGGLKPPKGQKAWKLEKEGTVRFRSRIYKNRGGQRIFQRGFLSLAAENNVTAAAIAGLAESAAGATALDIVEDLLGELRRRGVKVTSISGSVHKAELTPGMGTL